MKHASHQSLIMSVSLFLMPVFVICSTMADTYYVDGNNPSPSTPYTSWASAANNIQDAIDQAVSGDTVLVSDGQYVLSSELLVSENITLRSDNGPEQTVLDGDLVGRCVNLGSTSSSLIGFHITRGKSDQGGGVYCSSTAAVVSNCWISACEASEAGGAVYMGTVRKSRIFANKAVNRGGGASDSILYDSEISGNSTTYWAGAGGGLYGCTAYQCLIKSNYSARTGGGTHTTVVRHCVVTKNNCSDKYNGTGMYGGSAYNSIIYGNTSGGYYYKNTVLYSTCTEFLLSGTSTIGNKAANPLFVDSANDDFRLQTNSPCINAGDPSIPFWNEDYFGNDRVQGTIPDLGIYESSIVSPDPLYVSGATGDDSNDGQSWATAKKTIHAAEQAHHLVGGTILIDDGTYLLDSEIRATKDLTFKSRNGPELTIIDGQNSVRCFNFSGTESSAVGLTVQNGNIYSPNSGGSCINGGSVSNCIVRNGNGFYDGMIYKATAHDSVIEDSWDIGALECELYDCIVRGNLDTAIYLGTANSCIVSNNNAAGALNVMATNCSFIGNGGRGASGGSLNNCLVARNRSGGVSSARVINSQILNNTATTGSGVSGGSISNCVVSGNSASSWGGGLYNVVADLCIISGNTSRLYGGGAGGGTLRGCVIFDNTTEGQGGGTYNADLVNCTVVDNECASNGGGTYSGLLTNCIVYNNSINDISGSVAYNTCSPDLTHGVDGNITNTPSFSDSTYYLSQGSSCIDAGSSSLVTSSKDRDGNPRISGAQIDMGAYEWLDSPRVASSLPSVIVIEVERTDTPLPISLDIWNSGPSVLSYNLTEETDWLQVSQTSGSSAGNIQTCNILLNTEHLDNGTYWGAINVVSPDASNSSQLIGIVLVVYDPVFGHLGMRTIPSPRAINIPFPVSITAKDTENRTMRTYVGSAQLSASAEIMGTESIPMVDNTSYTSSWTGSSRVRGLRFTPSSDIIITHVLRCFGEKVSIWEDNGQLLTSVSLSGNSGTWTETELPTPLQLEAGQTYRIGAYINSSAQYYGVSSGTPLSFSHGTINNGCSSNTGDTFPSTIASTRYLIDFKYRWPTREQISISPANSLLFTNGEWSGLALIDHSATNVVVRADNNAGNFVDSNDFDVYPPAYDSDGDGLLDFWETSYYEDLAYGTPMNDDDGDGINNYSECMAGTNPKDPSSLFEVETANNGANGNVIRWDSLPGRIYTVEWCPNLVFGIYTNISAEIHYPQNSYTDTVHAADNSSFYRLNVKVAE